MIKKTYNIKGMDCTGCALVVESDLEDAGIRSSCSYAKQTLTVEFDEKKISEKKIKEVVKRAGCRILIP